MRLPVPSPRLLALSAAAALLVPGMALAKPAETTVPPANGTSEYSSPVSEVDACNQAQYLMPEKAVVQEFRYRVSSTKNGNSFICSVRWSDKASAQPTDRPILFPSRIRQPIFAAGWL